MPDNFNVAELTSNREARREIDRLLLFSAQHYVSPPSSTASIVLAETSGQAAGPKYKNAKQLFDALRAAQAGEVSDLIKEFMADYEMNLENSPRLTDDQRDQLLDVVYVNPNQRKYLHLRNCAIALLVADVIGGFASFAFLNQLHPSKDGGHNEDAKWLLAWLFSFAFAVLASMGIYGGVVKLNDRMNAPVHAQASDFIAWVHAQYTAIVQQDSTMRIEEINRLPIVPSTTGKRGYTRVAPEGP
jgi:hypothetical protein